MELNDNNANVWNLKGCIAKNMGFYDSDNSKIEDAICNFNKVILLDPKYHLAVYNKGLCLHYLKRYDESIECFDYIMNALKNEKSSKKSVIDIMNVIILKLWCLTVWKNMMSL